VKSVLPLHHIKPPHECYWECCDFE